MQARCEACQASTHTGIHTDNGMHLRMDPPSEDRHERTSVCVCVCVCVSQVSAVKTALGRCLTLWTGPPGTGKTTTIVRYGAVLRHDLLQRHRIHTQGSGLRCDRVGWAGYRQNNYHSQVLKGGLNAQITLRHLFAGVCLGRGGRGGDSQGIRRT